MHMYPNYVDACVHDSILGYFNYNEVVEMKNLNTERWPHLVPLNYTI
jgi:hypothetical protein